MMEQFVWFVSVEGEDSPPLFHTKIDAESYARELFPNEDPYKRYARIYYREVHTYEGEKQ